MLYSKSKKSERLFCPAKQCILGGHSQLVVGAQLHNFGVVVKRCVATGIPQCVWYQKYGPSKQPLESKDFSMETAMIDPWKLLGPLSAHLTYHDPWRLRRFTTWEKLWCVAPWLITCHWRRSRAPRRPEKNERTFGHQTSNQHAQSEYE